MTTEVTEPLKILVADDSSAIRNVFQAFPTQEILVRGVVADRQELLQTLSESSAIDAVLCSDHLTEDYGGVHALAELRASHLLRYDTAFILMSGDARKSNLMVDIEARPDSILLKPFAPATLIRKLQAAVHARRALASLRLLAQRESWEELSQAASDILDQGTLYPTSVARLKTQALEQLGQHDAVLTVYRTMLLATPDSISLLESLARYTHKHGNLIEAERTLERMLALQPANLVAADLLAEVKLERGDAVGAQLLLQQALRQSPNSLHRHRALGHLALLNGDTVTAQGAYLYVVRHNLQVGEQQEEDVVNAVRVLLLHGDTSYAWKLVGDFRKHMPDSLALDIFSRFVEAVQFREFESFIRTQARITEGIEMLDRTIMPHEGVMLLAAVEASLLGLMPHRAFELSENLLKTKSHIKLHPSQKSWAEKLHKWSRDVHNEDVPRGLLHYQKFMA